MAGYRLLTSHGGFRPRFVAGHVKVVELLIRAGADLHIRNGKALTAVGSATNNGHAEVVLKLVSHGAAWRNLPDVNVIKTICRKTNYKCAARILQESFRISGRHIDRKNWCPKVHSLPALEWKWCPRVRYPQLKFQKTQHPPSHAYCPPNRRSKAPASGR